MYLKILNKESIILIEKLRKNEPKQELEKSLTKAFKRFDKNNEGYIHVKDFEEKMTKTGEKLTAEEFKDMMRLAEIDPNGRISYRGLFYFYQIKKTTILAKLVFPEALKFMFASHIVMGFHKICPYLKLTPNYRIRKGKIQ